MISNSLAAVVRPLRRPNAKQALICLSYAGGGTARFRPWVEVLPDSIELVLICYPGREGRFGDPFPENWDQLMADVLPVIYTFTSRPYVLFGHSMGAWVAFEVTTRIEQSKRPAPLTLVVSASNAPTKWVYKRQESPKASDTDQQLEEWMHTIGHLPEDVMTEPDLRRIALDTLRADLRVSESYQYIPGVKVNSPMQMLYGIGDEDIDNISANHWQLLAGGQFSADPLPGNHFYTPEVWSRLPSYMRLEY